MGAFEYENKEDLKQNVGLKLDNSKSMFAKKQGERKSSADFEKKISEVIEEDKKLKEQIAELSLTYKSLINDKSLKKNKGPIKENLEKNVVKELIDIALRLNNDENQPEGIGSIGLLTLVLKCMLIQKDMINELSYKVYLLKNNKEK